MIDEKKENQMDDEQKDWKTFHNHPKDQNPVKPTTTICSHSFL